MSFTLFMWKLYEQLWFGLSSVVFLLLLVSSILRALIFKLDGKSKWWIGFIPLFGEAGFNNDKKSRVLFIVSALSLILSNGMYSWILLLVGGCTGYIAEYLTAIEILHEEKPVLYGMCPFYRYYQWSIKLFCLDNGNVIKVIKDEFGNNNESIKKSNIRTVTDTTKINQKL